MAIKDFTTKTFNYVVDKSLKCPPPWFPILLWTAQALISYIIFGRDFADVIKINNQLTWVNKKCIWMGLINQMNPLRERPSQACGRIQRDLRHEERFNTPLLHWGWRGSHTRTEELLYVALRPTPNNNCKVLNSANNLRKLGKQILPQSLQIRSCPTLIFGLWDPNQRIQWSQPRLLICATVIAVLL